MTADSFLTASLLTILIPVGLLVVVIVAWVAGARNRS
jgi:hypothetical protein